MSDTRNITVEDIEGGRLSRLVVDMTNSDDRITWAKAHELTDYNERLVGVMKLAMEGNENNPSTIFAEVRDLWDWMLAFDALTTEGQGMHVELRVYAVTLDVYAAILPQIDQSRG